jgi:pyruvate,water dikinase
MTADDGRKERTMSSADLIEETAPAPVRIVVPADFPVRWELAEDAEHFWILDRMHTPDPITPLDQTFAEQAYAGMSLAAERFELPARMVCRRINTYFYWSVVATPRPPAEMAAQAQRSHAKFRAVFARIGDIWQNELLPEVQEHIEYWATFDLAGASLAGLREHVEQTVNRHARLFDLHFRVVTPKHVVLSLFEDLYRELFASDEPLTAFRLLAGFENKTLETDRELWRLSQMARANPKVRQILLDYPASEVPGLLAETADADAFRAALHAFLLANGRRSGKPFQLSAPAWIEDPVPVLENLQNYVAQAERDLEAESRSVVAERERLVAHARERLAQRPPAVEEEFEFLLKAAQEASVVSEDHNFWIDYRAAYEVRRVFLEVGRRFVNAGVLDAPEDVLYLYLDEIREIAANLPGVERRAAIKQRQIEVRHFSSLVPPPVLGTSQAGPPPDSPIIRALDKFLGAPPPASTADVVRGHPGARGTVRGRVRVLRSVAEASKLHPGDILVAETTASPWTPLFATVAAVVTNTGGVLSHSAVVAREYGIPAVVGTGAATEILRDGQLVEVDGDAGIVRVVIP